MKKSVVNTSTDGV